MIVKKPCTFSLKEKEKVWTTCRTKSYSEACAEANIMVKIWMTQMTVMCFKQVVLQLHLVVLRV